MNQPSARFAPGFSLIELLVALAIIGVLLAITLPAMARVREAALATRCQSNLRQIGLMLNSYLVDSQGYLPTLVNRESTEDPGPAIDTLFDALDEGHDVMCCPSDDAICEASGTSYFWNFTINGQHIDRLDSLAGGSQAQRVPLFSDKEPWHPYLDNRVNVLYADGRVADELRFSTSLP